MGNSSSQPKIIKEIKQEEIDVDPNNHDILDKYFDCIQKVLGNQLTKESLKDFIYSHGKKVLQFQTNSTDLDCNSIPIYNNKFYTIIKHPNNNNIAIKLLKTNNLQNICFNNLTDLSEVLNEFVEENIINIILYCSKDYIKKKFPMYIQAFSEIKSLSYYKNKNKNTDNINIGLEFNPDESLRIDIFKNIRILEILLQIANTLYILQNVFGYMHRDLTISNISYKKNTDDKPYILYNGSKIYPEYFIRIGNLGNSCFTYDNNKIICSNLKQHKECDSCDLKKDFDLRILFASLLNNSNSVKKGEENLPYIDDNERKKQISQEERSLFHIIPAREYIDLLFSNYQRPIKSSVSDKNISYLFSDNFYDINKDIDINFYPENVIHNLHMIYENQKMLNYKRTTNFKLSDLKFEKQINKFITY